MLLGRVVLHSRFSSSILLSHAYSDRKIVLLSHFDSSLVLISHTYCVIR